MKSIEGNHGLFALPVCKSLNFPAHQLNTRLPLYREVGFGKKLEAIELAARILWFSARMGEWVGVDTVALFEQIAEDKRKHFKRQNESDYNYEKAVTHSGKMLRYYLLSIVTLGIYALLAKKPQLELEPVDNEPLPASLLIFNSKERISYCLQQLIDAGAVELFTANRELGPEFEVEVLVPTQKLLSFFVEA